MTLSEFSIRRPVFAWMLMSFLIIFGGISFMRMGISELPDVDFPVLNISLTMEGAAPEVMELDVLDVLEDAVMTAPGVKSLSSSARQGSANLSIEFQLNTNIDVALQEIQTRITQAQRNLPTDLEPPTISKANPEDQPIMWLSLRSSKHPIRELNDYAYNSLRDEFGRVPGVAEVFLGGFSRPNVRVWLDPDKLNQFALTTTDVINAIQSEHKETPSGVFSENLKEYQVRTLGEAKTLDDLAGLVVNSRGGQPNFVPVKIRQLGKVEEGLENVRRLSRTNGERSLGLGIRKQRGSNAVQVGNDVIAKMEAISKTLPEGMKLAVNFDGTQFIRETVKELNLTLILAALLTALVCWLFLGSFSSTINVLLAIPTSVVGTFIVLYFSDFTLNTFTLLGLSLSIGIVVDDAIMMLENIVRHGQMGKSKVQAAIDGSREITFAALVATLAVLAVFVPVIFMGGIVGKFLYQLGVTISVAVLLSLVEALTLTPMRCSQFVQTGERSSRIGHWADHTFEALRNFYSRTLHVVLDHKWKFLIASILFFVASFGLVKVIKSEFLPAQDQSRFFIRLQTPVGSNLEFTSQKFLEVEKYLSSRPEILRYFGAVGGFGGSEVNGGMIFVTMNKKGERGKDSETGKELTQEQMMDKVREFSKTVPDLKAFVQDLSTRGFSSSRGFPVEFNIRGPDWEALGSLGKKIIERLEKENLTSDSNSDYLDQAPELQIIPDREQAALRGVSVTAIGQTVRTFTDGMNVAKFPSAGRRYDIRVQMLPPKSDYESAMSTLTVRNNRGELLPLKLVTKMVKGNASPVIHREDRERAVTISANVAAGKSQTQVLRQVETIVKDMIPAGYSVHFGGSSQGFKESFQSLLFTLILGILVAYMILASQFNSFIHPITILMALPFSISGAFIALWISNQSLNLYSYIGLILLMGIVKKNSILLVEYTNQMRHKGANVREALEQACPIRLRPILMTSFATIAGAVPAALSFGPGAETRGPMAIAVIGGVFISTLLTLYVIPCVYSLFSRLEIKQTQ